MSQPAATQALGALEQQLETPLFERQTRGMVLSKPGKVMLPVVRQVLHALQASMDTMALIQSGRRDVLRLGLISPVAASPLGESLVAFGKLNPGLEVQVVEGEPRALMSDLAGGSLQVLLMRCPPELGQRYIFEPLVEDEALFVAGVAHPLVAREGLSVEDLLDYPWVRTPAGIQISAVFDELAATGAHGTILHPISTTATLLVVEILADNRTLVIAPASIANWFIRRGLVARLDTSARFPVGDLGAIYAADDANDPAITALLGMMRSRLGRRSFKPEDPLSPAGSLAVGKA